MQRKSREINSTFLLAFAILSSLLLVVGLPGRGEEGKLRAENVRFAKYGKGGNLLWEIKSRKSTRREKGTTFFGFLLSFHIEGENGEGRESSLKGEKLYLPLEEKTVHIKGKSKFTNGAGLLLRIQSPSWQPSEKQFSSKKISRGTLEEEGEENIELRGKDLVYNYGKNPTVSATDFQIIYKGENGKIELSGKELLWKMEDEIEMNGGVEAKTESGWKIKAEQMTFNREEKLLSGKNGVTFLTESKEIKGDSFVYNLKEDRIEIKGEVRATFLLEEGEE